MKYTFDKLDSGNIRIGTTSGRFLAQVPRGFAEDILPDEYIFQPEWNRDEAQRAWREFKEGI